MSELNLSPEALAHVVQAQKDARKAFRVLRETRTLSASGTLGFTHRIPGEEKLVNLGYTGPWGDDLDEVRTSIHDLNKPGRYNRLFVEHPDVTTIVHVHTPYLGAYAQAHSALPFLYVPVQRHRFVRELPVYIDRRQAEVDFIIDQLAIDPEIPGLVEANGGATIWSKKGILALADSVLLLEEGAQFQVLAGGLGGSKPLGPGVLQQQWRMSGLVAKDAIVDQDGNIQRPPVAAE